MDNFMSTKKNEKKKLYLMNAFQVDIEKDVGFIYGTYPRTKIQWWVLLEKNWNHIRSLITLFDSSIDIEEIIEAKKNKDPLIAECLEEIWWKAPDDPDIHLLKGWRTLCDLCSERSVLYDDEE